MSRDVVAKKPPGGHPIPTYRLCPRGEYYLVLFVVKLISTGIGTLVVHLEFIVCWYGKVISNHVTYWEYLLAPGRNFIYSIV